MVAPPKLASQAPSAPCRGQGLSSSLMLMLTPASTGICDASCPQTCRSWSRRLADASSHMMMDGGESEVSVYRHEAEPASLQAAVESAPSAAKRRAGRARECQNIECSFAKVSENRAHDSSGASGAACAPAPCGPTLHQKRTMAPQAQRIASLATYSLLGNSGLR